MVLPGIGGRLWDIAVQGRSILFQNPDLVGAEPDLGRLRDLPTRSPQFGFPLWGGEKTWVAPDTGWPDGAPYPVLDSAPYDVVSASATRIAMQSGVCPVSRLRITRSIDLGPGAGWTIAHSIRNCGGGPRRAGVWSVMMLNHPTAIEIDPAGEVSPVFGDPTGFVRQDGATLAVDCAAPGEFKVGLDVPSGDVLLVQGTGDAAIRLRCSTPAIEAADSFAHGHNFEVFNSGDYPYCEAEWHSPARLLAPGEAMTFAQEFSLARGRPPIHRSPSNG